MVVACLGRGQLLIGDPTAYPVETIDTTGLGTIAHVDDDELPALPLSARACSKNGRRCEKNAHNRLHKRLLGCRAAPLCEADAYTEYGDALHDCLHRYVCDADNPNCCGSRSDAHCTNWMTDSKNCGKCGNACTDPFTCINGKCECPHWCANSGSVPPIKICCSADEPCTICYPKGKTPYPVCQTPGFECPT
jgi:hypothetical protein